MKNYTDLQHKKVLVLGLAKVVWQLQEILHELGAFVTVNDSKPFDESPDAQGLLQRGLP